jgi:hypothetical protein
MGAIEPLGGLNAHSPALHFARADSIPIRRLNKPLAFDERSLAAVAVAEVLHLPFTEAKPERRMNGSVRLH